MIHIDYIEYQGDNIKLLNQIEDSLPVLFSIWKSDKMYISPPDYLYRASELSELNRILKYGTDRGGYPPKLWDDGMTPYDDIIYGTTAETIRRAEGTDMSSAFKKIPIIKQTDKPIILIYDINDFILVGDRQFKFKGRKSVKHIIVI